jgi:hypothetical protein
VELFQYFNKSEAGTILGKVAASLKDEHKLSAVMDVFLDMAHDASGQDFRYFELPKMMLGDCDKYNHVRCLPTTACPSSIDPTCVVATEGADPLNLIRTLTDTSP